MYRVTPQDPRTFVLTVNLRHYHLFCDNQILVMASRFCMIEKRKTLNCVCWALKNPVFDTFQYFYRHDFGALALGHVNPFLIVFKLIQKSWNPGFLVLQLAFSLHFLCKILMKHLLTTRNILKCMRSLILSIFPYIVFYVERWKIKKHVEINENPNSFYIPPT